MAIEAELCPHHRGCIYRLTIEISHESVGGIRMGSGSETEGRNCSWTSNSGFSGLHLIQVEKLSEKR